MNFALIDDHQMVREGFRALLEEECQDWNVVLEVGSAEEFLSNRSRVKLTITSSTFLCQTKMAWN